MVLFLVKQSNLGVWTCALGRRREKCFICNGSFLIGDGPLKVLFLVNKSNLGVWTCILGTRRENCFIH